MNGRRRRWLLPLLSIAVGGGETLLIIELVLAVLPVSDTLQALPVNAQNPVLRFRPNRDVTISRGYDFALRADKHVNNYGFVNDTDYDPDADQPLLAIIGDSYVEATQVTNREAMHGRLPELLDAQARVYSFGASGAPLSTYLAYAEYARNTFAPEAMVFVIVGNDFDESWLH